MRFFSKTSNACAVAVALAVMAAGVQAQGLKSPGSKAKAVNDPSISRALEATAQPSGRQAPAATQGVRSADYIVTGSWSKKALKEAQRIGQARCAATTEASNFTRLPFADEIQLDPFAAYLHVCTNETIHGVEIPAQRIADTGVPLVAAGGRWRRAYARARSACLAGRVDGAALENLGRRGRSCAVS